MKLSTLIGLLLMLLIGGPALASGGKDIVNGPSAAVDSLILRGIDLTLRQDYNGAQRVFVEATRVEPFHPAGYIYQAGLLQTKVVDDFGQLDWARFDSLLALAEKLSDAWIEKPDTRVEGYYYRGTVQAYRSYAASYSGDWLVTVTKGLSAVSDLSHAVELDSTYYDAYAGIGTYEYWKSRKLEFLTWLPIISDNRDEGVKLLEENYRLGRFNKYVAANSLIEVLMDRGDYDRSLEVAREVRLVYPDNRVFQWLQARVLERAGRYREACVAFQDILDTVKVRFRENQYPEIVCRLKLAKCLLGMGRAREAAAELDAISGITEDRIPPYLGSKSEEKREEAKELRVQIAKANGPASK